MRFCIPCGAGYHAIDGGGCDKDPEIGRGVTCQCPLNDCLDARARMNHHGEQH